MVKRIALGVNGQKLHIVTGKTLREWQELRGDNDALWCILFEELIDGTIEINEDIWYWYIDGRCYETTEEVRQEAI